MSTEVKTFPCVDCGADLKFDPGSNSLKCPYCGAENNIESDEKIIIEESDFHEQLKDLQSNANKADLIDKITVPCNTCGAKVSFNENKTAGECVFCGSHLVAQGESTKEIKPKYILPFKVNVKEATDHFKTWLKKRWFAPNKLKDFAKLDGLKGIYSPYWTYDSNTTTRYNGQRGTYYYTTESYTETVDGKTETKTKEVRHTRWNPVSGVVNNIFDDIIVASGGNLLEEYVDKLEPWDLENLVPYNEQFLSGFSVESYSINLEDGFLKAKNRMVPIISSSVKRDIGGDTQNIFSMNSNYNDIKFKHILLPVWISAYKYKDKVYQFMVNARTGEVHGKRPYSAIKIAIACIIGLSIIGGGIYFYSINN